MYVYALSLLISLYAGKFQEEDAIESVRLIQTF